MKKIAFLLFVCLFCLTLVSCGTDKTAADGELTPVKDDSGAVTGYERKYHNDNGDVTRWDVYDADEQYDHYFLYEYDSSNRLVKETRYQANGIGEYYYAYSYTQDGVIAEMDYVTASAGSTRTLYDSDGKEKERFSYDVNDTLTKYEVYNKGDWTEAELPTE